MEPQGAIDGARFGHCGGATVSIENLDPEVAAQRESMGHELRDPDEIAFGGGQVIMKLGRGRAAASDPRKDGMAAGH